MMLSQLFGVALMQESDACWTASVSEDKFTKALEAQLQVVSVQGSRPDWLQGLQITPILAFRHIMNLLSNDDTKKSALRMECMYCKSKPVAHIKN